MSLPANIRVNVRQPFPAQVQGSGPITVAKSNGVWTIGASYTQLSTLIAGNDLPNTILAIYDPVTKQFNQITASSLVQGLSGSTVVSVTTAKTIGLSDGSTRNVLSGNTFFAVNLQFANTYPSGFWVDITNADVYSGPGTGRAKAVTVSGTAVWMLYPGMTVRASVLPNGSWQFDGPLRWRPVNINDVEFYLDYQFGSDTVGVADGLAPGTSAFKTAFTGSYLIARLLDFDSGVEQTRITINLAAATNDPSGLHLAFHDLVGAGGGAAFVFSGATLSVTGAANNGSGAIRLTISPSAASLEANQLCSVYGVGGTVEANGVWKVTPIDSTHVDLQNSTFTHAFTGSGTITNGSGIVTSAANTDAIALFFGTTVQFENLLIGSSGGNGISAFWESKCYLLNGVILYNCSNAQVFVTDNSYIEADGVVGIAGAATYHVVTGAGGVFNNQTGAVLLPGGGFNFTGAFVLCGGGTLSYGGVITATGATVTGVRWQWFGFGNLLSATSNFNTDFPGSTNGNGSFSFPDGSTWNQAGPQLAANITGPANDKIVTQTITSNNATFKYNSNLNNGLTIQTTNSATTGGPLLFENSALSIFGVTWGAGQTTVVYNTSSDIDLKNKLADDVVDWASVTDKIDVVTFEWKSAPGEPQIGVIAQEICECFPQAVTKSKTIVVETPDGPIEKKMPWSVDYAKLGALALWNAKELRKRVASLEETISVLISQKK